MPQLASPVQRSHARRREGYVVIDGKRVGITEFGAGGRLVILAPSLMLSRRMHEPLAQELARRGFHVVCVNNVLAAKRGPGDPEDYSAEALGRRMVGLLDAIGGEVAVFGGTSIGASAALEAAVLEPNRTVGVIVEAPLLDRGALRLAPMLTIAHEVLARGHAFFWLARRFAGLLPAESLATRLWWDFLSASRTEQAAMMQGLMLGRIAPPRRERSRISVPVLVLRSRRDPSHSSADSDRLAADIPDTQLHEMGSPTTLRGNVRMVSPAIVSFLSEAFAAPWVIARTIYTPNIGDSYLN
ncbi:alpha/beta fold hydrolase [Lolliginicoccus levis]|uniref:alpha/beta fold hydrolase n=1 Tax=Lolliginicoccus levis TaxID=2919542 RepID=UPI00241F12D8|nr:alpha/beta hydrolase [Lolliginicoccus levis]